MSGYVTDESEMQQTDMDCSMTSSMTSDNIMRSVHERYSPVSSTHTCAHNSAYPNSARNIVLSILICQTKNQRCSTCT